MKLKEKILIDFKEFFKTGKFDFVKLGRTKEWVIHNFPDPDGSQENPSIYKDDIWRYGNIEFHFNNDQLFLIYSDYIDSLDGGPSLLLEKWFLAQPDKLDLLSVMEFLNRERIDFSKTTHKVASASVVLELQSRVELGFALEEGENEEYLSYLERSKIDDQNHFKLISFSLCTF